MGNYDFQNDFQNDAAKKNYEAAMEGKTRKGVDFFEKPLTWDEERPCDIKDTPTPNFIPIPTMGTGDDFKNYSMVKKIGVISAIAVVVAIVAVCAVTFFLDGGGDLQPMGTYPFW